MKFLVVASYRPYVELWHETVEDALYAAEGRLNLDEVRNSFREAQQELEYSLHFETLNGDEVPGSDVLSQLLEGVPLLVSYYVGCLTNMVRVSEKTVVIVPICFV